MSSLANRLRTAADLTEAHWDPSPTGFGIISALERAAGTGAGAADLTVDLWDSVVTHLNEELTVAYERAPGRTREQVAAMLRSAADALV